MLPRGKKKTLSEEINNLMTIEETNFDSDDDELTKAKTVECDDSEISDDDYRLSNIRTKTAPLLADEDERYAGKKISRKAAFGNQSDDDDSNEELSSDENQLISEDDNSISGSNNETSDENENSLSDNFDNDNDSNENSQSDSEENFDDDDDDDDDDNSFEETTKGIKIISNANNNSEIEKGKCVKNQLERWEKLLKTRILMQKSLAISNEMPQYNVYKNYMSNSDIQEIKIKTINETTKLLDNLLELQNHFLKNNSEIKKFQTKGNKRNAKEEEEILTDDSMDEEITSDSENSDEISENDSKIEEQKPMKKRKLEDYEKIIAKNHQEFLQYRNSVIQKFDDKTKISTGKANKNTGQNQSVLKQIEYVLNDREKLLKRTRLKRSNYNTLGKVILNEMDQDGRHVQDYDGEIFDDDDFYQQLLREVIESKCAENTDPMQLSRQWAQLQNMRNKMKRNIDTRATKGRRIRYVVHQKLVNFMAPITYNDSWTDSAKNELYNSLFGKSGNN
ncbi:protein AATF-like [Leptopilina boulardi]|uniref:protein AATF-like n=1 Tax=Leptopilina boulardi TaxID=63433 RepID=UPI0021F61A20|nr:protein AATF-like [Leptopilina boulardi]